MGEQEVKRDDDQQVFDEFIKMIRDAKLDQNFDHVLLQRYLKVSDNKLADAFALLKDGLELRNKSPDLFTNRDLTSKEIQNALLTFQFVPLKKLTKEKYKVTIIRFHKCDTSIYDTFYVIKTALMMFDANYTTYDNGNDGLCEGEIFVLDVVGFCFKQLLDVTRNIKTFLAYTKFLQEAAPVKLKQNHIVNTSSLVDSLMSLAKPILSKEVNDLVSFHKAGSDTLLKFIDKDVLPKDYGGENGTLDEHFQDWLKTFKDMRDYVIQDKLWKLPSTDQES